MIYLLNDTAFDGVVNLPVLETVYQKPLINLNQYNSIIITSKKTVEALEKMGIPWKEKHIFTVGKATEEAVKAAGGRVHYSAEGYGEELAREIIRRFPFGRYLYCRAKEVASDLGAMLKRSRIVLEEAVVYTTRCRDQAIAIEDDAVVIFTSPKIVRCFFKQVRWRESMKAVCIGKTTLGAMPKDIQAVMPDVPTLQAAVSLAKRLED